MLENISEKAKSRSNTKLPMFQIAVINGLSIPSSNPAVKQRPDPYAILYAEVDSRKLEVGRTAVCKKTSNPVWDKDASKKFIISNPNLKKLILIVFDSMENPDPKDEDPELGRYIISLETQSDKPPPFNQLAQLSLDTDIPCKFKPNVQIKITTLFDQISRFTIDQAISDKSDLKAYNRIYFTMTYDPPLKGEIRPSNLSFLTFDLEDGGRARMLPRACNNDDRGVKIKYPTFKLSQSGWSPIGSFNLPKLECHLFSQIEMLYNPVVKCEGYNGKVTLWCYGASRDITKQPLYLFSDVFEFHTLNTEDNSKSCDIITSSYVIQPSPNLTEYHIKQIDQVHRSNFQNELVFYNYMKEMALPMAAKKFLRLELDIDKAVTLSYASKFHKRSLPAQLVFYTDWMSTAGHPLDLGIELYDEKFTSIDYISAEKHDACEGALTWNVSTDGRFEKFKRDTLFLRVRLARLPKNAKYLSVALAAYSLKTFPLKWGGFFRLYNEDDMFEYMNLSIRSKGTATGVVVCIMMKTEDNDWLVIPTIQKFTIKNPPPGLSQHFRAIGDFLRDSQYLKQITASMNQYESPEYWYELKEKREAERAAQKEKEEKEKGKEEEKAK
ncbi:hypothetical protein TRFO_09096 [Tritrichomonas foetus]|uniref:C2 domain-containing protein n=1 Tax=Tritrichomonas foetus TaxID=1144522 RepID=A0A1J4JK96_9EUKA|nr:hypothetical protein TRFO_09096 [Tritrichomonas foetus]|eukprot:OHS97963.1 hypothetical protein TRFO_09096 [Tritrichomonas foetus]